MIPEAHPEFSLTANGRDLREAEIASDFPLVADFLGQWSNSETFVQIQTSGSTGKPSQIRISKEVMWHSAGATAQVLNLQAGNRALLAISPAFVGGMMMIVRAMRVGMKLELGDISRDVLHKVRGDFDFAALVPMQAEAQLGELYRIRKLILGGAPVQPGFLRELATLQNEVYATYGMTETVSHIALRRLSGSDASVEYRALPGVVFSQTSENKLIIHAPEWGHDALVANDVVEWIDLQHFRWIGRADFVINTGGVKVHPESVEEVLSQTLAIPLYICGVESAETGEEVVAVLLDQNRVNERDFLQLSRELLPKYHAPKRVFYVKAFPMTASGKIDRIKLKEVLTRT